MLTTEPANGKQRESLVEQLGEWLRERRPVERWAIPLIVTAVATLVDSVPTSTNCRWRLFIWPLSPSRVGL